MLGGVYTITAPSGSQYVGSAVSFSERWCAHRGHLRRGTHPNRALTAAAKKYGIAALIFKKLLVCSAEMRLFYEQRAMDVLKPKYNAHPKAGSAHGFKHSEATKAKIAKAHIGIAHEVSEETRRKISTSLRGKPKSKESVEAKRRAQTGLKRSPELCRSFSISRLALMSGPDGAALKAKISASLRAFYAKRQRPLKPRVTGQEYRAAMSARTREQMAKNPPTAEWRAKVSAATKAGIAAAKARRSAEAS